MQTVQLPLGPFLGYFHLGALLEHRIPALQISLAVGTPLGLKKSAYIEMVIYAPKTISIYIFRNTLEKIFNGT
jgi:hypothetical protein